MSSALHAAEQPPLKVTSPHFTLITDAGDKQARHILDNFEHMRWMFQTLFPKVDVDPPVPIVVIAVKNKKGFQALEPAEYLAKGQLELAGLFLTTQDKDYVLLRLDAEGDHPFATVYHEYTHLQFRDDFSWMPLWLNEGIAEFFQNTDFHDKQVLLGEPSTDDILYLRQNQLIPLTTLLRVDHNSPYYHQEFKGSVFYAESWALAHYLQVTDKEKGTNHVTDYMNRMSRHEDPVTAAQESFGDLKALENALGYYIRQGQYKQFILNSAVASIDPATYEAHVLTQPQFDAFRGGVLASIGRTQDARTLLQSVIQADPKCAQARESMGYIEFREGNREAARKWFQQAVELDSQSYLAHYYFAAMSMENSAPGSAIEIERSLRAAIQLQPGFAPAYDSLAVWLGHQGEKIDDAQALGLKAVELDRSNIGYRVNAANLFMMRQKFDDAEKILRGGQNYARTADEASMIARQIERLHDARNAIVNAATVTSSSVVTLPGEVSGQPSTGVIVNSVAEDVPPKHPTEPPTGPKHIALGNIHSVHCSYPAVMEFEVQIPGKPKPISLYTNNYYKLDLSALNSTPQAEMKPCNDIEGMKAKVQYAESSDKTVDGQVISIELHQ